LLLRSFCCCSCSFCPGPPGQLQSWFAAHSSSSHRRPFISRTAAPTPQFRSSGRNYTTTRTLCPSPSRYPKRNSRRPRNCEGQTLKGFSSLTAALHALLPASCTRACILTGSLHHHITAAQNHDFDMASASPTDDPQYGGFSRFELELEVRSVVTPEPLFAH
jgi:hypothetical protein